MIFVDLRHEGSVTGMMVTRGMKQYQLQIVEFLSNLFICLSTHPIISSFMFACDGDATSVCLLLRHLVFLPNFFPLHLMTGSAVTRAKGRKPPFLSEYKKESGLSCSGVNPGNSKS